MVIPLILPLDREIVLVLTPNLTNAIFARQAEQVENALSPHGLKTVICPVYPGTPQERDYVEALIDSGVAAIIFSPPATPRAAPTTGSPT